MHRARCTAIRGAVVIGVLTAACSSDGTSVAPPGAETVAPGGAAERPEFTADFGDAGTAADSASPTTPHELDARLKRMLRSVVGADYAAHNWDALLSASVEWSGVKIWVPGTGEPTADSAHGRAMASVPSGFLTYGPAVTFEAHAPGGGWLGVACSQSEGGALFAQRNRLSALEVFSTAWTDALAIVATFGSSMKGAWIVAHSAGAPPALLAGLVGGAYRVDAYGVPSAVGFLDGADGLVHLHTHPLDPAGAMGSIDAKGKAQIDLLGSFAVTVKAGLTLDHHDYSQWPLPMGS